MRSLPGLRTRLTLKAAGVVALAAGVGLTAIAYAMFLAGSRVNGLVGSAEIAVGAALQGQSGWAAPVWTAALVLAVSTAGVLLATRGVALRHQSVAVDSGVAGGELPGRFDLRAPDRALAEAGRGMLRFVE